MNLLKNNLILILLAVIISVAPIFIVKDGEFGGADGEAMQVIEDINPDYEVWYESWLKPKSSEIESLLFALQAAIGAGVVGFALGRITSKGKN